MTSTCAGCSTVYAVGLPACPNCGSAERRGPASALPQIQVTCKTEGCRARDRVSTVRLPSVGVNLVQVPVIVCGVCGHLVETVTPWEPPGQEGTDMPKITKHGGPSNALADPPAPEPKEEVASSPGSSSRTSSAKDEPSPTTKPAAPQKRARTTGSRSKRARTDSSSASGTGGDPTEATSETD